jgi:hypothetical protein
MSKFGWEMKNISKIFTDLDFVYKEVAENPQIFSVFEVSFFDCASRAHLSASRLDCEGNGATRQVAERSS